jgi:L-2-hydroxyglutarate oxidase LhgO
MSLKNPGSVGVVGGGILGLAVARQIGLSYPGVVVTVFEKEDRVAAHQTGHNSGVVHAGVYYKPGSLKAILCRRGASMLQDYAKDHNLRYAELGKLIVATDESERGRLHDIEKRALDNGVPGIRRIAQDELADIEPHVAGIEAIYSPHTASVDYPAICEAFESEIVAAGGTVRRNAAVTAIRETASQVRVDTGAESASFDQIIVCAGLQSDRFATLLGKAGDLRIIPFRGEYYELTPNASKLVRGMIYPVPDPRYPFLGVHLTRDVHDRVRVGPNAVMATALEGYRMRDVNLRDVGRIASWPGAWRLAGKHWRHGISEMHGSLSKRAYLAQVRRYLPILGLNDMTPSTAGVRAQVVDRRGDLVDDFVMEDSGRVLLVRNAPSPAATSSLAIAEHITAMAAGESR